MWKKLVTPLIFIVASSNPWILGLEALTYVQWFDGFEVELEICFWKYIPVFPLELVLLSKPL